MCRYYGQVVRKITTNINEKLIESVHSVPSNVFSRGGSDGNAFNQRFIKITCERGFVNGTG